MKVGLVTVAYNEERFIEPFLKHIPDWVDEKLVLVSSTPWQGEPELPDATDIIAEKMGATVIVHDWASEEEQRNAGQDYFHDYDWIIILDPDEFLDKKGWSELYEFLQPIQGIPYDEAYCVENQKVYWKDGWYATPDRDYKQLALVRPTVRFVDKRVVDRWQGGFIPVTIHHFSWARTDKEVWSKISHYAHAKDFDIKDWYDNVWLKWEPGMEDVHPTSPDTLHKLIPAELPAEIEELELWPT